MVHVVQILAYTPRGKKSGALHFTLEGRTFHARCDADTDAARGLFIAGASHPATLIVKVEGKAEYADPSEPQLSVLVSSDDGDRVSVLGRTWESVDHQTIKLDASPTVGLRLSLPQMATDFRGGSWLRATGMLCANLPPDEHD